MGATCIFSDDALNMPKVPESLVCIGGGVIAVELACMFNALRHEGHHRRDAARADRQRGRRGQARRCTRRSRSAASRLPPNARVESHHRRRGNRSASRRRRRRARRPSTPSMCWWRRDARRTRRDWMALVKAGWRWIAARVLANERMETNLPGVYAIGDLVGRTWLAHVAETEGEIAAENATGHEARWTTTSSRARSSPSQRSPRSA